MKKYVASIEFSDQVTEDSWRLKICNLEIDGSTTISDIETWIKQKGLKVIPDIQITELETLDITNTR